MRFFFKKSVFRSSVCIIILGLVFTGCKPIKVVERSSKERPSWVHGISRNFIIVEGVGNSHEQAQNDAFRALKEKIVSSVAVNVSSETQVKVDEQVINNMTSYSERIQTQTNISSGFINTLRGVSLNRADEFYWEKKKYKKTKEVKVHYHIKYPFSEKDLDRLVEEWVALDKSFTEELNVVEREAETTSSVYDLIILQQKAAALKELFTHARKTRAGIIEAKIEQTISNLKFETVMHERGNLSILLKSGNKTFTLKPDITITSQCAKLLNQSVVDNSTRLQVQYDTDFCSSPSSSFSVNLSFGNVTIRETYSIPIEEGQVQLAILEPVRIKPTKGPSKETTLWELNLRSFNERGFKVTKVEIVVTRSSGRSLRQLIGGTTQETFVENDINQEFEGKGDFSLQFQVYKRISTLLENLVNVALSETNAFTASGKIFYIPKGEERERSLEFENIKIVQFN